MLLVSIGHVLGVLAPLIIQVGVDIYRFFTSILKTRNAAEKAEQVGILVKKVYGASIMCGASLVFASIGAGIGAKLLGPSTGQRIGTFSFRLALENKSETNIYLIALLCMFRYRVCRWEHDGTRFRGFFDSTK